MYLHRLMFLLVPLLCLAPRSTGAQENELIVPENKYSIACVKLLYKDGLDYIPVCCSDSNPALALKCAYARVPNGHKVVFEDPQDPCRERLCPAAPTEPIETMRANEPTVKVILNCCGCNGVFFRAHGLGRNYCEALESARENACIAAAIENTGGIRSWCVSRPVPCKPKPLMQRLFRR